jgi:hypothetical protein
MTVASTADPALARLRPWWDALADLAFHWPAPVPMEDRAGLIARGRLAIHFWGEYLAEAGFTPGDFLRPESGPGADDGGLLWKVRPGSALVGVLERAVITRGPLGFLAVHVIEPDGRVCELRGRPRIEIINNLQAGKSLPMECVSV